MNYQMDYFYGHEANQFTFFRIPKLLFSDERFIGLTSDAKILYGLMLDRMGLSVKNGWLDEKNHVYARCRGNRACGGTRFCLV